MITSTANEKIKHVTMLVRNAKARRKEGLFVVEGERIASDIPKDILAECFVTDEFMADGGKLKELGIDTVPTVVSQPVFKKMSDTQSPQGILCVCRQNVLSFEDLLPEGKGKS